MTVPEDLKDITFDKAAFGYRADEVDRYIDKMTNVVSGLMEENRDLEEKLEVLAAKVEEYKRDEDSLHAAVLGAQKLGDSIVRDSKLKAEGILREATVRSERLVEGARRKVEVEQQNFTTIHKEVNEFRNRLISMYKSHIELISTLPSAQAEADKVQQEPVNDAAPASQPADPAAAASPAPQPEAAPAPQPEAAAADPAVQPADFTQTEPAAPEAPADPAAQQHQGPFQRYASKYGDLQFGDNVNLK